MDIRILPSNIANMIAAGEVVQRPSSVVKELMENAVDAGATKINVIVVDAGRTLVQVIDNGCGMTPDQAVLCFQRHATSKIATAEDLETIETFGFRGEALPSIAAIAEVVLNTRTADSDVATRVSISDASPDNVPHQTVDEVSAPVGSNFAVRNLYYNTPARRKFLKSDAVELRQIISEFTKIALVRPDLSFSLTSNGKDIYRLGPAASPIFRIADLLGKSVTDDLITVRTETEPVVVDGFIGRPDNARKSQTIQYFFVNGRYFRSPYLHKAIMKAYENLLPPQTTPSYILYLTVDPRSVDINVHPTKTEVKFEDDNVLFSVLMAAVRRALGQGSFGDSIDFDVSGLPELRGIGSSYSEYKAPAEPQLGEDPSFNPFESDGFPNQSGWSRPLQEQDLSLLFDSVQKDTCGDAQKPPVFISGKYLMLPVQSGMMLLDASRAMERILFERFVDALSKELPLAQSSLFPVEVEIGAAQIPVVEDNSDLLRRLGFSISVFSPSSVLVSALPEGLVDDRMSVTALLFEIVTALSDEQASLASAIYGNLAEKLAKSAARTAVMPASSEQASALTDALYSTRNPEFTPDGKKIVVVLNANDFEKLLK